MVVVSDMGAHMFHGRTAIITGASRGIGRDVAVALGKRGCNVVIAAKTATAHPSLPGTIHDVFDEIESEGGKALPFQLDVRDERRAQDCVDTTIKEFGGVDFLINNASAMWWKSIEDTPMKRYDMMNTINARGTFALSQACLPHMREASFGHIVMQSPPIQLETLSGMVGYYISKYGMTLSALGIAQEYQAFNVAANAIWPKTLIKTSATIENKLGNEKVWRKPSILTDAIMGILEQPPSECTGHQFIDEHFLREWMGVDNFEQYQCVPGFEPPPIEMLERLMKQ